MTCSVPLSQRLREGTKKAHRAVERIMFVRAFLRGVVEPAGYSRYLTDLLHVYEHLERGLEQNRSHAVVAPLNLPALRRQEALQADLDFFARHYVQRYTPSAAALRYGDRLQRLARQRPELLVAHAYVRQLGDLSGGQILRRIAARALQLAGEQGLAFYSFPQIADLVEFKREYRGRLDRLPADDVLAEQLVTEAVHAFALNGAMFQDLNGSTFSALWKLIAPSRASAGTTPREHVVDALR